MSRSPRKRSKSRRRSLRRRSDDGPSDDDSGAAEPRDFQEDRRDPGRRGVHARKAVRVQGGAASKIHAKERSRESTQEERGGPPWRETRPTPPEGAGLGPREVARPGTGG